MKSFERERPALIRMAARMLGSAAEAEEIVQEAGLRLFQQPAGVVVEPAAWLRTVVARLCLDALRARRVRGHAAPVSEADNIPDPAPSAEDLADLADGVGLALLVVLSRLAPEERVAFVLHDVFETPFAEIARILGKSPDATRQIASRARRRVRVPPDRTGERAAGQRLVAAFHAAGRSGDVSQLMAVLAPDIVLHYDGVEVARGAAEVASRARAGAAAQTFVAHALIGGAPGIIVAPGGQVSVAMRFSFGAGRISAIDVIRDPDRLAGLDLALAD